MENKDENLYNKQVFAKNIRYYMNEKKVTQKELSEKLEISQGSFSDWMNLRTYPRMDKVQKLAEFFGCEKSDLVEDRSLNCKYHLTKRIRDLEALMAESKETLELHLAIEELSPANKALVKALVESLKKGEK